MIYVFAGIVVVVLVVGAVMMRRKSESAASVTRLTRVSSPVRATRASACAPARERSPVAIPTPEEASQEIAHDEFRE